MRKHAIAMLLAFTVVGCASRPDETYARQLQEIEVAHINGEITKGEYLQMKNEAENASIQRKQMRQQRATTYNAGQQQNLPTYQSVRNQLRN
ncbi:hypothetical protein N8642_02545 [bacterium]|jgi:uncharacterized protein YcfL|nr:hypothetical protein [bacterium]